MRPVLIGLVAFAAALVVMDSFVTHGFYTERVVVAVAREVHRVLF